MDSNVYENKKINVGDKKKRKDPERLTGIVFIIPLMFFITVFTFFPAFYSFAISLFHYNPFFHSIYFVGASNYMDVIRDPAFIRALINVLIYTAVVVTVQTFLAFGYALLFNTASRISRIARAIVFIPAVVSPVSMSIIFIWVFSDTGLVNYFLSFFGIPPHNWLFSTTYAFPAIMAMNIFTTAPYFMIVYSAGLQSIPSEIMDAAKIDGLKSGIKRFRYIYFPLMRFSTILVVILGLTGAMQLFDQIYVITDGGPARATYVPLMYIYNRTFVYVGDIGLAAAASFVLFVIIMILTVTQRKVITDRR
ncbi:carbohydrate ABC transporter membrane protein 1, CUT1 family [Picrophilus oshimae DSM 9789]|uniref:Carbohydrate ABC transporter membrane protein 1, CUT1 family n=1 Tax=Picrophilus torridus (strain ATCC 700027 / DSM 9790 / JCM 10055 / NBRC 100828 / KAW 2/3) TaxID=1122961 RepID=A0A8G2FW20_PICTO|nr:carbohydrate ABC transporter membrane protein 1, CUT1 family [Picrophilus oshimae DSM 9789]